MDIKPCPFCGSSETKSMITFGSMFVGCNGCGATGPRVPVKCDPAGDNIINGQDRQDAWNNRSEFAGQAGEWTEEEKEQAWYCAYCSKPMKDNDSGFRKAAECFCSKACSIEFFS